MTCVYSADPVRLSGCAITLDRIVVNAHEDFRVPFVFSYEALRKRQHLLAHETASWEAPIFASSMLRTHN